MKIATWNVNSVRARLPLVLDWLKSNQPDVLLLQETKCTAEAFPAMEFTALGYHGAVAGQKTWNGVAILSLTPPEDVVDALPGDASDTQARYIEATINGLRLASVYLPNGNPLGTEKFSYKLAWMERLRKHAASLLQNNVPFLLGGDFNIIQDERDCTNFAAWQKDALGHPDARHAMAAILNLGLTDSLRVFTQETGQFTFFDYKSGGFERGVGLRIDLFLASPLVADRLQSCVIDTAPRAAARPSDHTPLVVEVGD